MEKKRFYITTPIYSSSSTQYLYNKGTISVFFRFVKPLACHFAATGVQYGRKFDEEVSP